MKIDSANIPFAVSHGATVRAEVRETLQAWTEGQPPVGDTGQADVSHPSIVAISAAARMAAEASKASPATAPPAVDEGDHDPVQYFIKLVVEALGGLKVKTGSAITGDGKKTDAE